MGPGTIGDKGVSEGKPLVVSPSGQRKPASPRETDSHAAHAPQQGAEGGESIGITHPCLNMTSDMSFHLSGPWFVTLKVE